MAVERAIFASLIVIGFTFKSTIFKELLHYQVIKCDRRVIKINNLKKKTRTIL